MFSGLLSFISTHSGIKSDVVLPLHLSDKEKYVCFLVFNNADSQTVMLKWPALAIK